MKIIQKVLVANRGEIAVRIMKTVKEMGLKAVAVYSDVDKFSKHVLYADEAYSIGEAEASESYLNMEKIIGIAKMSKCDVIHPGYGFLAENSAFAKIVADNNLIWIGPSSESMKALGDKINSRKIAESVNIPVIPGGTINSDEDARKLADKLGYPILIKASAGGGGKGMRIVNNRNELNESLKMSRVEAEAAFSDSTVYIEKLIEDPHHIEIQFLIDQYGNGVYFPERECSIQRRYQKIIEETPSPTINRLTSKKMGEAALSIANKAGYVGAGTVEFILDKNKNFYFLEVNARIQVEHPVTEQISNVDFIEYQIFIAEGNKLVLTQDELDKSINGHAIEARIYAEDAGNNFIPSVGVIEHYREPAGVGIRVDSGVYKGSEIVLYYDPIISKVISKAHDRQKAIKRLYEALSEYHIAPIKTTIPFLKNIMTHPAFFKGEYNTNFINNYKDDIFSFKNDKFVNEVIALFNYISYQHSNDKSESKNNIKTCWDTLVNWRG